MIARTGQLGQGNGDGRPWQDSYYMASRSGSLRQDSQDMSV
jgi:hypothetical protein